MKRAQTHEAMMGTLTGPVRAALERVISDSFRDEKQRQRLEAKDRKFEVVRRNSRAVVEASEHGMRRGVRGPCPVRVPAHTIFSRYRQLTTFKKTASEVSSEMNISLTLLRCLRWTRWTAGRRLRCNYPLRASLTSVSPARGALYRQIRRTRC